jgi:hypothetical protein
LPNRPPRPPPPGPYAPDPRDEILDRVSRGEIAPDQAEAEAARLGIPPFARTPDPTKFNPMTEPWWTLGMAAAWIIWRTPTAVRRVWSDYRNEVTTWQGPLYYRRHESGWGYGCPVAIGDDREPSESPMPGTAITKGYYLERQLELSLFDVVAREAQERPEDGAPLVEGMAAVREMWGALQSGNLVAEGIPPDSRERCAIRDAEWIDLDYFEHAGWPSDAIGVNLEERERYRSVRVRSEDVTRVWIDPRLKTIINPPRLKLPPTVPPTGGGFIPLYCAAQWIASRGGAEDFDPLDLPRWKTAYEELLARMASEDVRVVGKANGVRELVAGVNFVACPINYPFQDTDLGLLFGSDLYLLSYPYCGDEDWNKGMDDSLWIHRKPRWSGLMVEKNAIAKYWPYAPEGGGAPPETMKTGAAGRPSVMHLLRNELTKRHREGRTEASLAAQAEVLRRWVTEQHPSLPCPAQTTTENGLRALYRATRTTRN